MTDRIRTSLSRAPSGWTEAEIRDRARARAVEAWQQSGILVVSVTDDRMTWPEREMVRQLGNRLNGGNR